MTPGPDPPSELRRELGLLDAVGIGFGAIVGAGIFVVTGVAAGIAGPAMLAGLVLAGVAAAANALSSAELAAEFPQSGGSFEYGYRLLSPAAGWMFLASKIAAAGTVAIGLAAYLATLLPGVPPRAVVVVAVGAVAAIVAATGTLAGVASAAAFAILVYYGIANLAALRLPAGAKRYPRGVAWTGLAGCALLATSLETRVIAIGAVTLAAGFALRAALRPGVRRAPEDRD